MILVLRAMENIREMNQALSVGNLYSVYRHETDKDFFFLICCIFKIN